MKEILLQPVTTQDDKDLFIKEIQKAFQDAFEREYGKFGKTILPTSDIEESFNGEGAQILFAFDTAKRVGGVVVAIDPKTQNNSLDLLYVKDDSQNSGYGIKIWKAIEQQYPNTKVWQTHTPYFDKRNLHFYINKCGFKIVEFFNPKHRDPHQLGESTGNIPSDQNNFFRFEKQMY